MNVPYLKNFKGKTISVDVVMLGCKYRGTFRIREIDMYENFIIINVDVWSMQFAIHQSVPLYLNFHSIAAANIISKKLNLHYFRPYYDISFVMDDILPQ